MLGAPDGKRLCVAFTDRKEYDEWCDKNGKLPCFTLTMEDYAQMLLAKNPLGEPSVAVGLVINPLSTNLLISRELVANLMTRKMMADPQVRAMMQAQAAQKMAAQAAAANAETTEE